MMKTHHVETGDQDFYLVLQLTFLDDLAVSEASEGHHGVQRDPGVREDGMQDSVQVLSEHVLFGRDQMCHLKR